MTLIVGRRAVGLFLVVGVGGASAALGLKASRSPLPVLQALAQAGGGGEAATASRGVSHLPLDVPSIFRLDERDAKTQLSLEAIALDEARPASLRYSALRRLEELCPGSAVHVAETVALQASSAGSLQANAVAVLVRSGSAEAAAALERVRGSSKEAESCVSQVSLLKNLRGGR